MRIVKQLTDLLNKVVNITDGAVIPICIIEVAERYGTCYGIREPAYTVLGMTYVLSILYDIAMTRVKKKYKNLQAVIKYSAIGISITAAMIVGYIIGVINNTAFR